VAWPLRRGLPFAALVALAAIVGFAASRGNAASVNSCLNNACFSFSVLPTHVSVGSDGLAVARYTDLGTAPTTHTTITVTLPSIGSPASPVAVVSSVLTLVGGTQTNVPCTIAPNLAAVTCDFGSVGPQTTVKAIVRFTVQAAATNVAVLGKVSFAESNSTSPTTDTVQLSGSLTTASTASNPASGKCGGADTVTAAKVVHNSVVQAASATYPASLASLQLPCTPAAVGIDTKPAGAPYTTDISFVELTQAGSAATVTLDFAILSKGTTYSTFVLQEIPGYPVASGAPLIVAACVNGSPVGGVDGNGNPVSADSCIVSRAKFGGNGAEVMLNVWGSGGDPGYVG
jgi:hypothetical protein